MKWLTVEYEGMPRGGLLDGDTIRLLPHSPLDAWVHDLEAARDQAGAGGDLALHGATLIQPIARPRKVLAIGLNYAAHVAESVSFIKNDAPSVQKWFNKQATAANGPYAPVEVPAVSEQLDYEAELVVIIGKRARHVPEARAMEIVAGYACGCDYSVRDWQRASPTMIMGKGFDTHAPFGPYLVTPDEVGDFSQTTIRGIVNGEVRQSSVLSNMIFSIPQQIAHLTAAFTLEPGDVIFTGTPAGVGAGHKPPKWLQAGDTVRVEIDGVGAIENPIVQEVAEVKIG